MHWCEWLATARVKCQVKPVFAYGSSTRLEKRLSNVSDVWRQRRKKSRRVSSLEYDDTDRKTEMMKLRAVVRSYKHACFILCIVILFGERKIRFLSRTEDNVWLPHKMRLTHTSSEYYFLPRITTMIHVQWNTNKHLMIKVANVTYSYVWVLLLNCGINLGKGWHFFFN